MAKVINKNIIQTVITQAPTFLSSIIVGIIITRLLGPEKKGVFILIQTNAQLLVLFFGLSLDAGIVYFIAKKSMSVRNILGISLYTLMFAYVSVSLMLYLTFRFQETSIFIPSNTSSQLYIGTVLFLMFFFQLTNSVLIALLQGKKLFLKINIINIVISILNFVFFSCILLLDIQDKNLLKMILGVSVGVSFFHFCLLLFSLKNKIPFSINLKLSVKQDIKPFFKYIFLTHVAIFLNFFNYRLDLWIIAYFLDNTRVGFYSLAVGTAQLLWMISTPLANVVRPYLIESDFGKKTIMLRYYAQLNFSITLVGAVVLFLCADYFIPLIYGSEFQESVLPFKVLLIGALFSGQTKLFATFTSAINRNDINLYGVIVGLSLTILLDLILIPYLGILGASITSSVAYISVYVFIYIKSVTSLGLPRCNYYFLIPKFLN